MGSMNASGWLFVVSAGGDVGELWDLLGEFSERAGVDGATIHAHTAAERRAGAPRYCLHPTSDVAVELKGDDLHELLTRGASQLAQQIDEDDVWRRD